MTLYNRAEPHHRRPSFQTRPIHPEDGGDIHPRCREMADAMREGADTYKALTAARFSPAEITAHHEQARALAREESVRHVHFRPDDLADIIEKACVAMPNRPPLPRGTEETQPTMVLWNRYCMARAALTLDPWASQRERCLGVLRQYLDRTALFGPTKSVVVKAVEASLPQVAQ